MMGPERPPPPVVDFSLRSVRRVCFNLFSSSMRGCTFFSFSSSSSICSSSTSSTALPLLLSFSMSSHLPSAFVCSCFILSNPDKSRNFLLRHLEDPEDPAHDADYAEHPQDVY